MTGWRLKLCCVKSHRSRGAWIEIFRQLDHQLDNLRRIAHAVRGLKFWAIEKLGVDHRRIAHAVRGLK